VTQVTNLALPNLTSLSAARFALGARTGVKFETHDIDDLSLSITGGAPTNVNYIFTSNSPAGSMLLGSAAVTNGFLSLTPAAANQAGSFILRPTRRIRCTVWFCVRRRDSTSAAFVAENFSSTKNS